MAINTNPYTSLAGTFHFEIDAGAGVDANAEILDLGTIEYEFDLMPSDKTIDTIAGMPGAMKVTFDDALSNRGSLYETLVSQIGVYSIFETQAPKALVTGILQEPDNTIHTFPFQFTIVDVALDERSKKTTIDFSPRVLNLLVNTWVDEAVASNSPTRMSYGSGVNIFINSWPSGDFIHNVVQRIDTSINTNTIYISGDLQTVSNGQPIFERLTDILNSPTNITVFDAYSSLMFVQGPPMQPALSNSVFAKVQTFAGMEGAIFGSAFSMNYYINRLSNIVNVSVTNNEIIDLSFKTSQRDINSIIIKLTNATAYSDNTNLGDDLPKITNAQGGFAGFVEGSRSTAIDLTGFFPQLNRGVYNVVDNYVDGNELTNLYSFLDQDLCRFASCVYAHSTGVFATNRALYSIELELMGATKVKPYEVIKFDSTVPARYQGKHFRPTSLSYDLQADTVRISAYEINSFEVIPTTTTTSTTTSTTTTSTTTSTTTTTTVAPTTTTVAPTTTTVAPTTTTAAPTTTTTTLPPTTTTTTVPPTTTTTTTVPPTTTTTTSTTTTTTTTSTTTVPPTEYVIIHDGLLNEPAVPFSTANEACAGIVTTEVYSSSTTLAIGISLFNDIALTDPIAIGYYSIDGDYIEINPAGTVSDFDTCPTTSTSTTTLPIVYTFACFGTSDSPVDGFEQDFQACGGAGEVAVDLYSTSSTLGDGIVLYTDSLLVNKLSPAQQFFAFIQPPPTTTTTSTTTGAPTTTTTSAPTTTTTSTTTTTAAPDRYSFRVEADGQGTVSLYEQCPPPTTTTTSTTTTTLPAVEYTILHDGSQDGVPTPWSTESSACNGRFAAFSTSAFGTGGVVAGQSLFGEISLVNPLADGFYVHDVNIIEIAGGSGVISTVSLISSVCPTTTTTTTAAPTTTTTTTTEPPTTTTEALRYEFTDIGYDASSSATACAKSTTVTIYSDNDVLADSTVLFEFSSGATKAAAGFYSDGFEVYNWNGTNTFTFEELC